MKKLFLIAGSFLIVCCASAQQTLTLKNILENIEKNNPLLKSYGNKISADSAMVGSAKAWLPPKVGLELDNNPYSFDKFYSGIARFSFAQDFPNGKVISAKTDYLESLSQIDMNESMYQRNKLFSQAKEAYYGIYIAQKNVQILKESIEVINSMIELAEKQMATGKGDMAAIFKLKAKLPEKETKLVHDENMIKSYMATVNYLMSADVNQEFTIDTNNIAKDYKKLIFIYNKDSIECKRSDIMQMSSLINSMKLNQTVISMRSKPTFGILARHYDVARKPDMFSIMGTMVIPIAPWSARGYKSEAKAMEFRIASMKEEKENMVNMTSQKIKMLVIEMNSEYQEIDNYTKKVLPAYKKSFDVYLLGFKQNTSDLFMVLMAFDDLQMAQMEYINHLETLLKVQVNYEKELQIR